jgi:hypothetical protein
MYFSAHKKIKNVPVLLASYCNQIRIRTQMFGSGQKGPNTTGSGSAKATMNHAIIFKRTEIPLGSGLGKAVCEVFRKYMKW